MEQIKSILLTHAARYPKMQPTDAVKLLFQSEFGGGHLVADEERFRAYLRAEYERTPKDEISTLCEEIGDGMLRVYLAPLDASDLDLLAAAFLKGAKETKGSVVRFEEKLAVLRELTEKGTFAFSPRELDDYLTAYRDAGYPAVSHSDAYRQAYRPAYRIVRKGDF